jgi:hypothetical protein
MESEALRSAVKSKVKRTLSRSFFLRRMVLGYRQRVGQPDWKPILEKDGASWREALRAARGGPKVLVATSFGGFLPGTTLESILAVALTLRGTEVDVLLCDAALPACHASARQLYRSDKRFIRGGPQRDLCRDCFAPAHSMFRSLDLRVHTYGELLSTEDKELADRLSREVPFGEIKAHNLQGLAVGEHAFAGALRYYARGTLDGEPGGEAVLRRYFKAAILSMLAVKRLLDARRYGCAVFNHGLYVPQGLVGEASRQMGVRVVNWHAAYRRHTFIFSHGDTYHHTLIAEPTSQWEDIRWSPKVEERLLEYLRSRWEGKEDWIWFHSKPELDSTSGMDDIGVDFSKPVVGLLTNVVWDAQLHYPTNAFPTMLDWILETIRYFEKRPDLELLIRVHPAEVNGTLRSRQPVVGEIAKAFPSLPGNVHIIPSQSSISTYAAMLRCDSVLIFGTKTGVELASMGLPVIVAGEAWIRNKGLTLDAGSREDYIRLLDRLPLKKKLDDAIMTRARKYAFHFFFRRMIPLEILRPVGGPALFSMGFERIEALLPGRSKGLDVICDGILKGTDFVFKAEETMGGE